MATILRHPSIAAAPSRPSYVAPVIIRLSFSPRSVIPTQRVFISSFCSTRASNSPVAKRFVPLGASGDSEAVETAKNLEGTPVEVQAFSFLVAVCGFYFLLAGIYVLARKIGILDCLQWGRGILSRILDGSWENCRPLSLKPGFES